MCVKILLLLFLYMPPLPMVTPLQQCVYRVTPARIALLLSWLGCVSYAAVAGFSLPTQRALIMLSVVYLASALRQRLFSLHSFALALLLILLAQPAAVLGAGLFLSFAAVAWIAYILHLLPPRLANWKKVLRIQLLLPICLWPLLQFYFGNSATLGALANIVLIPLVSVVLLPLCLLATFLELLLPLKNHWLMASIDCIYQYVLIFLQNLSSYSWARSSAWPVNIVQVLLLQLAIALVLLPMGATKTLKITAVLMAGIGFLPHKSALSEGEFKASVMDVGQGLSVLVQTRTHTLLFDTGPEYPSGFSASKAAIVPYLQSQGIQKIDILILSHGDQDHLGGLAPLMSKIEVSELISGQPKRIGAHMAAQLCSVWQTWSWDGVTFKVLWPLNDSQGGILAKSGLWSRSNNHSCVLQISTASQSMLLTGDIEKPVERLLLNSNQTLQADFLVAPHHGSNSSSSRTFIRAVNPAQVVFSAAYRSRFGHPHKKVVQRYLEEGVDHYTTARCGQLIYAKSGISCYREQSKQRWQMKMANK